MMTSMRKFKRCTSKSLGMSIEHGLDLLSRLITFNLLGGEYVVYFVMARSTSSSQVFTR